MNSPVNFRGVIPTTNSWSTFWSFFGRDRSENDQGGSENDQPRSENDQPAFIKSRYRFGSISSLLDLLSGLEMALAGIGNEMDRSIAFGMHLKAILPPTWVPLGSVWASLKPHWAPSWPHLSLIGLHLPQISTPFSPYQLH